MLSVPAAFFVSIFSRNEKISSSDKLTSNRCELRAQLMRVPDVEPRAIVNTELN